MRDFYLTLPSNTEGANNTTSSFRVNLPTHIDLQGEWEVALSEIFYPNSWRNIIENEGSIVLDGLKVPGTISIIPSKKYNSITELTKAINESLKLPNIEDAVFTFKYDQTKNRVVAKVYKGLGLRCKVSKKLQYILGFENQEILSGENIHLSREAEYPPDLNAGFTSLFVYCNLIVPQVVGNVSTQVIRVVNVQKADYGENIEKAYPNPHYVPMLSKEFSSVEINIKDDVGNLVKFEYGKVIIKLHFRRRRLSP